jgi:hypothetical protein
VEGVTERKEEAIHWVFDRSPEMTGREVSKFVVSPLQQQVTPEKPASCTAGFSLFLAFGRRYRDAGDFGVIWNRELKHHGYRHNVATRRTQWQRPHRLCGLRPS